MHDSIEKLARQKMKGFCAAALAITAIAAVAASAHAETDSTQTSPIAVTIGHRADGSFVLMRQGQPYFIKGAGGSASKSLLRSIGGNSVRTWGSDTLGADLADAQANGLTVAAGIWLGHEAQGFNYGSSDQVNQQRTMVHDVVVQYRDSTSLLIWSLGNEMEGDGSNAAVWHEVEFLAKMVKKLDPHHPIMTVICEPIDKKIKELNDNCPDVDIVGINAYASAPTIASRYVAAGGVKPYILTEFGPPGQWEQPTTSWGASIELSSTSKADWYRNAYVKSVQDQKLCLGSYAFLWGNKQEATATWYGMVLPTGEKLAAADTMSSLWNDEPVTPEAPVIDSVKIDGPTAVTVGSPMHVSLDAADPGGQPLEYNWVLRDDRKAVANGGESEASLQNVGDAVQWSSSTGAEIVAPSNPGSYRIFVYLRNKKGDAAVANIPFLVTAADSSNTPVGADAQTAALQTTSNEIVPKAHLPYYVYGPAGKSSAVYFPSGYMGNTGAIKIDPSDKAVPGPNGGPSMKVSYTASDNWGGVVWQSPANDWGEAPGGLNLSGATKLTFWARGADGSEVVTFKYGLIGSDKRYHDSSTGQIENVKLTTQWTQYSIDLSGKNLSDIKTAFVWTVAANGKPITFYLDDIKYE